jgi:arsenate reductase (thioredoxin)
MPLEKYIARVIEASYRLELQRIKVLEELRAYIKSNTASGGPVKLTFICTHNSRRSHLVQIWAQKAALHHGLSFIQTFSGGTETTAFNPRAVAALRRAGLTINDSEASAADNPRYEVIIKVGTPPVISFSKMFDHPENPQKNFCAVMTCSEADESCPIIFGANSKIRLIYQDPKVSDGTNTEIVTYDQRCLQIASEMFYVMRQVKGEA